MADTRVFDPTKDTAALRRKTSGTWGGWTQNSADEHLLGGFTSTGNSQHVSLINFDFANTADFKKLLKAELHVFTADDHSGFKTQKNSNTQNIRLATLKHPWSIGTGPEGNWDSNIADNVINEPSVTYRSYGKVSDVPLHENVIDVTAMVRAVLPKTVLDPQNVACLGLANLGWHMTVAGDSTQQMANEWACASKEHSNTAIRPFVVLTFEPKGGPGITVLTSPDGDVASGTDVYLQGEYEPGRPGDIIQRVTVEVKDPATGVVAWTAIRAVGNTEVETSTFIYKVVPDKLKPETPYKWTARIENQREEWTPWASPSADIRYRGTVPTLASPSPAGTHASLLGVPFRAIYSSATQRAALWQVQLRTQIASNDPTWADDLIWDSGQVTVPAQQWGGGPVTQTLSMSYGGPLLPPATYSFRMQAHDRFNAETDWLYGQVILTAPYVTEPGGDTNPLTTYARQDPFRIRIYGMAANRGPGTLLAELTDASNVGASEYYNAGGEFYFTIPATHPQISVIEPYQVHYALETHTPEGWRGKAFGIITDFDATEDEVVFYGMDYMAVLGRLVEERFDATNPDLPTDKGGAKYVNRTIDYIIKDQLTQARTWPKSPLGFVALGDVVAMPDTLSELYVSFKNRLPLIAGLIDSYRAGTGRKTRLVCERDVNGGFRWRVLNDPGINRDNLRMEYGGLIQGFRTVPFSGWGTAVNAVGRTVMGTKVYADRAVAKANDPTTGDPIDIEARYGAWPSTAMYQDLDDLNDLRRRTAQAAAQVAKVGKLMGIGIRVGGLNVKDGWDICDSVPIRIKRGVVDTERFGSGYWTIWGWNWQSYPDGHYDLNLTLAPRQDTHPANPDLIPASPILDTPDFATGVGPPNSSSYPNLDNAYIAIDISNGDIYEKDPITGEWENTGNIGGPPGTTTYTWVKYADTAAGVGMTDDPTGKAYIGIATNKTTTVESTNPADYAWSRTLGPPGADGATLYTWVKYADTNTGTGISDDPTGKAYIGFAYNKTTTAESNNPADYAWSPNSGASGPPGPPGSDGTTFYTWVKYANDALGTGMSDSSAGKAYLGLAFNKTTSVEGTNPADYQWSKIEGPVGPVGPDGPPGTTLYTWVKYADTAAGVGMSDDPTGKAYIGVANNKTTATESTNPADYAWSKILGDPGPEGPPGTTPPPDLVPPSAPIWDTPDLIPGTRLADDGTVLSFIRANWQPLPSGPPNDDFDHFEILIQPTVMGEPKGWDLAEGAAASGTFPVGQYEVVVTASGTGDGVVPAGETLGETKVIDISDTTHGIVLSDLTATLPLGMATPIRVYVSPSPGTPARYAGQTSAATMTIAAPPSASADLAPTQSTALWTALDVLAQSITSDYTHYVNDSLRVYRFAIRSVDVSGNKAPSTALLDWRSATSLRDTDEPEVPAGVRGTNGNQLVGVVWSPIFEADLSRYEVRWQFNKSTFTTNPVTLVETETPGTWPTEYETGYALTNSYAIRLDGWGSVRGNVRAIDRSGNASEWSTSNPLNEWDFEARSMKTLPSELAVADLWAQLATIVELNAGQITGGDLTIIEADDHTGSILIYKGDVLVGRWSSSGWYVIDSADPTHAIRALDATLQFTKDGVAGQDPWLWPPQVWTTAISADGISATYITTGSALGGHNRVLNSGFELTPPVTAAKVTIEYNVIAEWDTTGTPAVGAGSLMSGAVNKATGTNALTQSNYGAP